MFRLLACLIKTHRLKRRLESEGITDSKERLEWWYNHSKDYLRIKGSSYER